MSEMVPPNEILARESFVDWDELSGLDKVVTIYQVGANTVVVDTCDGREVKITAWFDRRKGEYVADFERRSNVSSGGKQLQVWAHTNAYPRSASDDLISCLESAILAVDRIIVY